MTCQIHYSGSRVADILVELRENYKMDIQNSDKYIAYITISPNPLTKHKCERKIQWDKVKGKIKNIAIPYGKMTHEEQYEYCIKIIERIYLFNLPDSQIIGTWELNKSGNVHIHMLLKSDSLINEYQLQMLRRDVLCHMEVYRNLNGKNDFMNNIVWLTEDLTTIIEYFDKDYDIKRPTMIEKKGLYNFYVPKI